MKHLIFILAVLIVAILPNTSSAQTYTETTGESAASEDLYASVRGWIVYSGTVNGRFVYCVAVHPDSSPVLRLGNSVNRQWQLSIAQKAARIRKDWNGVIEVDGNSQTASGSASGVWTVAWLGMDDLERIKQGNDLILGVGKYDFEFSLKGATAAVLKVQECIQNQGRKPSKRVTQRKTKPRIAYNQPKPRVNNVVPRDANGRVIENEAYRMGAGCPKVGTVKSPNSNSQTSVEFIDQTSHQNGAMTIYWLDGRGRPVDSGFFENGRLSLNTYVGHSFVVKDRDGTCYGGVYTTQSGDNKFTVR